MQRLTKFEKEIRDVEHQYFKVKHDLYGYKIMVKASGVKKFNKSIKNASCITFQKLAVTDFVMVKYKIPKGADIYVSEFIAHVSPPPIINSYGWKKCRASEVEIVEIRSLLELEEGYNNIYIGKQYNGYAYSIHTIGDAYVEDTNPMLVCSDPATYGRCKKGQKLLMKNFFHLTPVEVFDKVFGGLEDPFFKSLYNNMPVESKLARCRTKATCNTGFHFFMTETEAINYLLYAILLRD